MSEIGYSKPHVGSMHFCKAPDCNMETVDSTYLNLEQIAFCLAYGHVFYFLINHNMRNYFIIKISECVKKKISYFLGPDLV